MPRSAPILILLAALGAGGAAVAQSPVKPWHHPSPVITLPHGQVLPPATPPDPTPSAPLSDMPDLLWADGPPGYVHDIYFARTAWGPRVAVPPSDHPQQWRDAIWKQGDLWFVIELDGAPDGRLCLRWHRTPERVVHDECQAMPAGRARLSYAAPQMGGWPGGTYRAELVTVPDEDTPIEDGEPFATLSFGAGGGGGTAYAVRNDSQLPSFPWPPPRFTSKTRLDREWLVGPEGTLGDAAERLERALRDARYELPGYYAIPGGFAMATRMEQIEPDGTPLADELRWSAQLPPRKISSLGDYLKALFTAPEGYYRVIVFTFTDQPVAAAAKKPSEAEANAWSASGGDRLPETIAGQPFSRNHRCLVLVYEFRKLAGSEPTPDPDGAPPASVHLERSGILAALQP